MEELKSKVEKLTDNVEGLLKTYYRLTLVRATQKAAKIGSTFLNAWFVIILSFFMLLFAFAHFLCLGRPLLISMLLLEMQVVTKSWKPIQSLSSPLCTPS